MTGCLEGLERLHDDHPTVFPQPIIQDTWEELHWRFWEELKEVMRALKREAGRDSLRRSDIILLALAQSTDGTAWLKLPATFSLESTAGWFRASILPRIERKHQRALWELTWKAPKGDQTRGPGARAGGDGPPEPRVYPAGKKLGPHESKLSTEHAPLGPEGTPICWGAATHMGCLKNSHDCSRSHQQLPVKLNELHWCVRAQIVRRGGLKCGKRIEPQARG